MEIYILRHGIAEDGRPGAPDSSRQLTEEGRVKTSRVIAAAKQAGVSFSLILSSPFDRAVQTSEAAAKASGYKGEILKTRALTPEASPEAIWSEVREYRDEPSILLASHEPLVSNLVGYLLGAPALRIEMKKSVLVRIDFGAWGQSPRGTLRWMITPALAEGSR
jgi:phosphohistidine phosphatase